MTYAYWCCLLSWYRARHGRWPHPHDLVCKDTPGVLVRHRLSELVWLRFATSKRGRYQLNRHGREFTRPLVAEMVERMEGS